MERIEVNVSEDSLPQVEGFVLVETEHGTFVGDSYQEYAKYLDELAAEAARNRQRIINNKPRTILWSEIEAERQITDSLAPKNRLG